MEFVILFGGVCAVFAVGAALADLIDLFIW